jgi:hypothetical protein
MFAGLAVIIVLAAQGLGQTSPYETIVTVPEVEVRSGPSINYYATGKLRLNQRVRVIEEKDGGWLAIEPPDGSFSWIEARVLGKVTATSGVVMSPEVPVRAGSSLSDRPPDVVTAKLPAGSQVVILGEAKVAEDGTKWLPIKPQKEVRYIFKGAVKTPTTPVEASVTGAINPGTTGAGQAPTTADALWLQAEQARDAGKNLEAQQFYEMCLRQPGIDASLRWRCLDRLQNLRENPLAVHPGYQPGRPAESATIPQDYRPPTAAIGRPTTGFAPQGQSAGYAPPPPPPAGVAQTTRPGHLRRAGFFIDGKQAYALEDSQGQLLMYVTAQGNLNLDAYLNRNVSLTGAVLYHGQLKHDYIVASQISLLP